MAAERSARMGGYALAVMAAACWALNGLLANWLFGGAGQTSAWRVVVPATGIDAAALAADRALVAFVILAAWLAVADRRSLRVAAREVPFLAVFGVAGLAAVQYAYYRTIEVTGQPTVAILLEYLAPVIVLVFSVMLLGERFSWALPAGVALAVAGCALVVGAVGRGEGLAVSPEGLAWGLAAAVFFAAYSLLGRHAAGRFGPWTILVYGLGSASVAWLIVLGPSRVLSPLAEPSVLAAVLFSAIVGTIIPFGAYLMALARLEATKVSVTAALEPVFVAMGEAALFGAVLAPPQLLGGVLVVAAILAVQRAGSAVALPLGE